MVQAEVVCWLPQNKSIQAVCGGQVYTAMHSSSVTITLAGPDISLEAIKRNICV